MKKVMVGPEFGTLWQQHHLMDLDFAGNLALLAKETCQLQEMTTNLGVCGGKDGLRISSEKTKSMSIKQHHGPPITTGQQSVEEVNHFTDLGSKQHLKGW